MTSQSQGWPARDVVQAIFCSARDSKGDGSRGVRGEAEDAEKRSSAVFSAVTSASPRSPRETVPRNPRMAQASRLLEES